MNQPQCATRGPAEVAASRFAGWVDRFLAGHGDVRLLTDDTVSVLHAADGATARLDVPFDPVAGWADLDTLLVHVARVGAAHPYLLLLVRRGGWAVGRCAGERVLAGKAGARYVQGRTRKGGSSQQRYARRRANQAGSVVSAAADAALGVWGDPPGGRRRTVVTGGDRLLVADAVELLSRRLPLEPAARRLDVPDPRRVVLDRAAVAACAVRVTVTDAADSGAADAPPRGKRVGPPPGPH